MGDTTGFKEATRRVIQIRAGWACELCGMFKYGMQIHHRRPRRMGGDRRLSTNTPSNGLYLCAGCHRRVEEDRAWAIERGLLVSRETEPHEVPVSVFDGTWLLLDHAPWRLAVQTEGRPGDPGTAGDGQSVGLSVPDGPVPRGSDIDPGSLSQDPQGDLGAPGA